MPDQAPTLGMLLRAAPPDRVVEAADSHLRQSHGARWTDLLIADHTLTELFAVLGDDRPMASLDATGPAARCFAEQRPVAEPDGAGYRLYLPATIWGERVGVLVVELAGEPAPDTREALAAAAAEVALALRAADRDTDRYRRIRRRERLTMAAELQWDLLPGRSLTGPRFAVAGQLEPAYTVAGDHFDWALNDDRLTLTVLNGDDGGLAAALLTAVTVNAMRNARRSGANLVEQAELASEAVYAQYGGARHTPTLLLDVDLVTGQVESVDAGSPRALLARDGDLRHLALEQQLPLGMFGDARYEPQRFALQPGDRLLVVSDGVHAATPGGRAPFGESALSAAAEQARGQPAAEAVSTMMRALSAYHDGDERADDAVIVCFDWLGPVGRR